MPYLSLNDSQEVRKASDAFIDYNYSEKANDLSFRKNNNSSQSKYNNSNGGGYDGKERNKGVSGIVQ